MGHLLDIGVFRRTALRGNCRYTARTVLHRGGLACVCPQMSEVWIARISQFHILFAKQQLVQDDETA